MSQSRRTIEQLLQQSILPLKNAEAAATHLEVYPSKRTWLSFFDKALLIIGAIALVLSLVFFIAYNWQHMGKIGKFALVEAGLVISIALYVALSFKQRFQLIRQLLLLIASVITGSLLALFGQVYQTGADTWQLFFGWAILITPWVIIARFPALWLLWLGLINASLILYFDVTGFAFASYFYEGVLQIVLLAVVNFVALNLWLIFTTSAAVSDSKLSDIISLKTTPSATPKLSFKTTPNVTTKNQSNLHWSTYIVGITSTYFMTHLAIMTVFEYSYLIASVITISLWLAWCGFMLWRFYQRSIDLLMLTYLSFSIIITVMFWAADFLLDDWEAAGFLLLAILLIGMSSAAVVWLRKVARLENSHHKSALTNSSGDNYE